MANVTPAPAADCRPVLVVEDDSEIADAIRSELYADGYRVAQSDTVQAALDAIHSVHPSAIVVDRALHGEDGLKIVEIIRGEGDITPVLLVSELTSVEDRIDGLRAGGDDYLVKPFDARELSARIEALLRRHRERPLTLLRCGDLEMNLAERKVVFAGRPVLLLPREFTLLEYFIRRSGQVISRAALLADVWNFKFPVQTNVVDVQIGNLRRKLDPTGARHVIVNVRGVGFRLNI